MKKNPSLNKIMREMQVGGTTSSKKQVLPKAQKGKQVPYSWFQGPQLQDNMQLPIPVRIAPKVQQSNERKAAENVQKLVNYKGYTKKDAERAVRLGMAKKDLKDIETTEYRASMHPDFQPGMSAAEQRALSGDGSLRARLLRGANMMSNQGTPLDIPTGILAAPGRAFANLTTNAEQQYFNPNNSVFQNALNLGLDVADVFPTGVAKGLSNVRKTTGKFANNLVNPAASFTSKPSSILSSAKQFNLEDLRRAYHNSKRFLQPDEIRYLRENGYGDQSLYRSNNYGSNFTQDQAEEWWRIGESNNQLPPPPAEIRIMPDGSRQEIYALADKIDPNTFDWTADTFDWTADFRNRASSYNIPKPAKKIVNKSGLTKEEVLQKASSKDQDVLSKMSETEFENTVLKPNGEIAVYKPGPEIDQMTYDMGKRQLQLNDAIPMSNKEYVDEFNSKLDLLNDIIAQRNKSGVQYKVKGLDERGGLTFHTPEQSIPVKLTDKQKANVEWFNRDPEDWLKNKAGLKQEGNKWKMSDEAGGEEFNSIDEAIEFVRNEMKPLIEPKIISGESTWGVKVNPGQWRGNVEDIANTEYFRSIPGLEMSNTTSGVFADNVARKGTGAYESINEYLKRINLGRVKPGFNSQTEFSRGAWENFIKSGRGVGFYANPKTVYGTMKTLVPPVAIVGAAALQEKRKGGPIVDPRGQWAHPGKHTIVPTPTGKITMQGVSYPVYGQDETGYGQMMYPGGEYQFPGQMIYEIPKKQFAQSGTLVKDKTAAQIIQPISNLNLRPIINLPETKEEYIIDPSCPDPDGLGCSYIATREAQKITGLPLQSYGPANAAYRDAVAKRIGMQEIFQQIDPRQISNANSRSYGWHYPTQEDFKKWRAGDIVTLDSGDDEFTYSAPKGYSETDNAGNSHIGTIAGFTPEGRAIIKHGLAKGKGKGKVYTEVLGDDNRVSSLGHGRYAIKSVWRPKEINAEGNTESVIPIVEKAEDIAKRKQATNQPASFYLKNSAEQDFASELPVAAAFSQTDTRLSTKNNLLKLFNNKELDKDLQYKLGITSEELNNLKPVIYGIAGQESNFNDPSFYGDMKDAIKTAYAPKDASKGLFQIKYNSLSAKEREVLGIKSPKDLLDDKKAYQAAILLMKNAKQRIDKEVEQGTHPELADKDPYFRAAYYYNSPARAITSAKDWGKTEAPMKASQPSTWFNWLPGNQTNRNYVGFNADKQELRMDKGSYPYKLMEKAKDLGVDYDMETPTDLEEIIIYKQPKNKNMNIKRLKKGGSTYNGGVWFKQGGMPCFNCGGMYMGGGDIPNYMQTPNPLYNFGGYFPQAPRFDMGGGFIPYPSINNYTPSISEMKQGGIHIDPSKKGTFTAAATRAGMGVQAFASKVLSAPEGRYTPGMRKKANFAKNAAGWKKEDGGLVEGQVIDVTPDMLERLKMGGYTFEIVND